MSLILRLDRGTPMSRLLFAPCVAVLLDSRRARADEARRIRLSGDATAGPGKRFRDHLLLPAKPGPLTLYYPEWLQGEDQASGPIADLAGLHFAAGGKPLTRRRDVVDMH